MHLLKQALTLLVGATAGIAFITTCTTPNSSTIAAPDGFEVGVAEVRAQDASSDHQVTVTVERETCSQWTFKSFDTGVTWDQRATVDFAVPDGYEPLGLESNTFPNPSRVSVLAKKCVTP